MKYVTLFPEAENVHLIKSCGMIPFVMKKFYGYDSTFVCYENGNYDYLDNEVKGLKLKKLKRITNNKLLDSILFLIKNAKNIDVLHMYHLSKRTLICSYVYKFINKKGVVYLKLDNTDKDYFGKEYVPTKELKLKFKLMKNYDVISTESSECYKYINSKFPISIKYIQNGFYEPLDKVKVNEKKNIILTVSRIGTKQKNNEMMLEGFSKIHKEIPDWKLRMIGPVEKSFEQVLDSYLQKDPTLASKIEMLGEIKDREILNKHYNEAKIFTLTSIFEGFPTVYLEALKSGCYLVSTNFNVAKEITNFGEFGSVAEINDTKDYANKLLKSCKEINFDENLQKKIQDFAVNQYYWPNTCKKLDGFIKEVRTGRA